MSVLEMVGIDRAYVETRLQQGRMDNPRDESRGTVAVRSIYQRVNFTRLSGRS